MKLNQTIATVTSAIAMTVAGNALAQDANPSAQTPVPAEAEPAPPPSTGELAPAPLVEPSPSLSPIYVPDRPAPIEPAQKRWQPASGFGLALMAGGGVTDFTQGATRDFTGTGGSWDARLAFGTREIIGFEASYVGGANTIHNLGTSNSNTNLVRNGVEGGAADQRADARA